MDWSDWAIPLFSALLGAGAGGGLSLLASYRSQRMANEHSLQLAAAAAIAEDCYELGFALASYDIPTHLRSVDAGGDHRIPNEVVSTLERRISRILVWAEDAQGIHDRFQRSLAILRGNFAGDDVPVEQLRKNIPYRTIGYERFRTGFQTAIARLPREGEATFCEKVDALIHRADAEIAH